MHSIPDALNGGYLLAWPSGRQFAYFNQNAEDMKLLEWFDRLIRPIAVPNLTVVLITCQAIFYVFILSNPNIVSRATLVASKVLEGEVWRLCSFVMIPPTTNLLFALIAWYLFYLMGNALESQWGTVRYNVFLWVGMLLTMAVAFLAPNRPLSNAFLAGSVFLAFATFYPDFELRLFFILPVKIKWLALLTWIGYAGQLLFGFWEDRLAVVASVGNYLLFFGPMLYERLKSRRRRQAWKTKMTAQAHAPRHVCGVCEITNLSHPDMDFRYCSTCDQCFCNEHLRNHEHAEATETT